jgi:hypothetical protein
MPRDREGRSELSLVATVVCPGVAESDTPDLTIYGGPP